MRLSIIVVNWNTRALLAQCLSSVYTNPPSCEFGVWVVDNGSTDGSVEMLREHYPQVHLIANTRNAGFARANNQAIRQSQSGYVLLLNSDTVVQPESLTCLLMCMNAHPKAGIVGAKLLNPNGSFQASYNDFPTLVSECLLLLGFARYVYSTHFPSHTPEQSRGSCACDWVPGACLLARRAAVEQVGLLDEEYEMYVEETDWCFRMFAAGWQVWYCSEAPVVHYGGQSAQRSSLKQQTLLYRSKTRFLSKHRGLRSAKLFRTLIRLSAFLKSAYWTIRSIVPGQSDEQRERARVYLRLAVQRES